MKAVMSTHIQAAVRQFVSDHLTEDLLDEITAATPADPFLIDHDCLNPAGHDFIASCGDIACVHCSRIA